MWTNAEQVLQTSDHDIPDQWLVSALRIRWVLDEIAGVRPRLGLTGIDVDRHDRILPHLLNLRWKNVLLIRGQISFFELKQIIFWPLLDKTFDKESHLYHLPTIRLCVFLPDVVWVDVSSSFCRKTDIQLWPRGRCRCVASMLDARSTFCRTESIAEPAKDKIYWSTNKSSITKSVSLMLVDQNL